MIYVGSKRSISKEIVPIIQSYITEDTKGYLEPFVGGANIIDKIQCGNKIGCDVHKQLIELFKQLQKNIKLGILNQLLYSDALVAIKKLSLKIIV